MKDAISPDLSEAGLAAQSSPEKESSADSTTTILSKQLESHSPDILYHAKCIEGGNVVKVFYAEQLFEGLDLNAVVQKRPIPLIEVIVEVNGKNKSERPNEESAPYVSRMREASARFGPQEDFDPDIVQNPTIHIHSQNIQNALRSIVKYYPSQNLSGKTVLIEYPYRVLMHHLEEFKGLRIAYRQRSNTIEDAGKLHDIDVLLNYIIPVYAKECEVEALRHARSPPVATYNMLWLLFKPGTDVYTKIAGKQRAFVVMSTEEKKKGNKSDDGPRLWWHSKPKVEKFDKWCIKVWYLCFDGSRLYRKKKELFIEEFYGEREVTTLNVVPSKIFDRIHGNGIRKELEKRGKLYYEILKSLPAHLAYSGTAVSKVNTLVSRPWEPPSKRALEYDGPIVIDPAAYTKFSAVKERVEFGQKKVKPIPEDDGETDDEDDDDEWAYEPEDFPGEPKWLDYNRIEPKARESLTEHQQFLLPNQLRGFALKAKDWMAFEVSNIKPIEFPPKGQGAIDNLILPRDDIEFLKSLSAKTSTSTTWGADFVKGKGEGQTFLFHGPPGTGKTYTVESVAQNSQRPLLSLTVADLGTSEGSLEQQLTKWFGIATMWGAILLIDEADVFLEKRRISDIQRNSLVSLFLRSMEYYSGLLFLTTNRPGAIDDAFLSRIHSAIEFPNFNATSSAQLWSTFFEKIKKEQPKIRITSGAKNFVRTDKNLNAMEWSGREIRNAFTIALTLARYEHDMKSNGEGNGEIEVKRDHFEEVAIRRTNFIKYIDHITGDTADLRAFSAGDRRDATLGAGKGA